MFLYRQKEEAQCSNLCSWILGLFQDENRIKEDFMLHLKSEYFFDYLSNINPKWAVAEKNKAC